MPAGLPPPYDPTPPVPFTPLQRRAMVMWIEQWYWLGKPPAILDPKLKADFLAGKEDQLLHDEYDQDIKARKAGDKGKLNPPNAPNVATTPLTSFKSVVDFLNWLRNSIPRLGEIAVGVLIVGVSVNAMMKGKRR